MRFGYWSGLLYSFLARCIDCGQSSRKYAAQLPFTALTIKICNRVISLLLVKHMPIMQVLGVGKEKIAGIGLWGYMNRKLLVIESPRELLTLYMQILGSEHNR